MYTATAPTRTERYARCLEISKRVRWDIEHDVIRGRELDLRHKYLPDGLSCVDELGFLSASERRFISQVQGRTYANMFGLVERFIGAQMLEISREHCLGDQTALQALVRFADEEMKHQELFLRVEQLAAAKMPDGYGFVAAANDVAAFVLSRRRWSVLALSCHIELFTQAHYRASIAHAHDISPLFKDVFLFHWKEESQHAILDELEWVREDARLADDAERDAAVDDLLELVSAVDGIVVAQARADSNYALQVLGMGANGTDANQIRATMLKAYRWQYIVSGLMEARFQKLLVGMVSEAQMTRIRSAMGPLAYAVPLRPGQAVPAAALCTDIEADEPRAQLT
jgi:hypothetical protein